MLADPLQNLASSNDYVRCLAHYRIEWLLTTLNTDWPLQNLLVFNGLEIWLVRYRLPLTLTTTKFGLPATELSDLLRSWTSAGPLENLADFLTHEGVAGGNKSGKRDFLLRWWNIHMRAHTHSLLGTGNCDRASQVYRRYALTIVANVVGTEIGTRKCLGQKTELKEEIWRSIIKGSYAEHRQRHHNCPRVAVWWCNQYINGPVCMLMSVFFGHGLYAQR
jgi:hypothetical protein